MKRYSAFTEYTLIVAGAFIMGFAIKNMFDPISLVTGGVTGIAIILKSLAGIPLWLTNTLCNIPLFFAAWKIKGWRFIKRTAVATGALSLSLYVIPEIPFLMEDLLLTSLFGGIISGLGTGLVFLFQATTGGTDMLAALLQRKMRHYSIAQIMQVLDAGVVLAGAAVFGVRYALYALIAIYGIAKVSDGLLEGLKFSKQAYIISDQYREIAKAVMTRMDRGVTAVDAVGMYSGQNKKLLFCVVSKKEIVILREIVAEFDKKAFVIVSDVREVFGEGFIEY
ncbi:MAG: YitT family protein [Hungatella sp.]|jgi:uncharacterized membrane-anchored protein YitT (DUF2179 family)|nr:YitT family protein [Hungatella sp.]